MPGNPSGKSPGFYRTYERMDDFPADKIALVEVLFINCCAHIEPDASWNTGWIDGHVRLIARQELEVVLDSYPVNPGEIPVHELWTAPERGSKPNYKAAADVLWVSRPVAEAFNLND